MDKPNENITTPGQPGANDGNVHVASDPKVTVQGPDKPSDSTLTLTELNNYLGKNFTSKDKALESLKETARFVGVRKEELATEVRKELSSNYISKEEFDTQMFYKEQPGLAKHRTVIDAFAKANGLSVAAAASHTDLKSLIDGAHGFAKSEEAKSVITSNPKLQAVKARGAEVKTLIANGNSEAAGMLAAKLILEAYEE